MGGSKPQHRDRYIPRAASVILSLLARRDTAMSEAQIQQFFARSLVGDTFSKTLGEALHWMCDSRRILAYRTEDGSIAPTSLGKAAIRGTLPLVAASGFGSLVRDVLSLGEEQAFFGEWSELDHLLIAELLSERTVNLRPFSEDLARQVDSWIERSPKKSVLYRSLLRGSADFSKADELFGSLLIENSTGEIDSSESARRKGYLAMFRAIVLWERACGGDPPVVERNWRISDLLGVEEQWRDDRIWLLSALVEICDIRCFYFHLQQECEADEERVRETKRQFQRLRVLAFDALGRLKYCSPLGPLLVQMRRSAGHSPGVGAKTIQKLENLGVTSLATLAKMSDADFEDAGIGSAIAKRIRAYIRRRLA